MRVRTACKWVANFATKMSILGILLHPNSTLSVF